VCVCVCGRGSLYFVEQRVSFALLGVLARLHHEEAIGDHLLQFGVGPGVPIELRGGKLLHILLGRKHNMNVT